MKKRLCLYGFICLVMLTSLTGRITAQEEYMQLEWSVLATTLYTEKYIAELNMYYGVPDFTNEVLALDGANICIRGYLDIETFDEGPALTKSYKGLTAFQLDEANRDFIFIEGLNYRTVESGMVEICGRLQLSQSDITKPVFTIVCANSNDTNTPPWIALMEMPNPDAHAIRKAFEDYHKNHAFVKTRHTQAYKRWISQHRGEMDVNGLLQNEQHTARGMERGDGNIWSYAGPRVHVVNDGTLTPGFRHSNVYCHDRSSQDTNVLYCGTESGGAYKTVDGGQTWFHVTADMLVGDVQSLRMDPQNQDRVIMSAANDLWRTTDGGLTWNVIGQTSFVSQNIRAHEIAFSPDNTELIYAATNLGFFRSTDGGDNWTEVLTQECNTLAIKPNDPSVIYTIQRVSDSNSAFYKSVDYGETWTSFADGWFENGVGVLPEGGRLAVTAADPERIYALLVGYQIDNADMTTNGWIGTWVSYDAGTSWALPHGFIGTPYNDEHPNLMNFNGDDGDYTQINYNTTMIVSQLDPDKVLIGGLNLWMSTDACATYQGVGGYIGGIDYFHVDQQEYRVYLNDNGTEEIWFSNDGGIGHSSDFMASHENLNDGIRAVNLWGYDQGWNEDMMVGGRYHNGNMAYHELYPAGEFLALGGGEAPTGYVNYSDENRIFHSDIGGYILGESLSDEPVGFNTTMYPNESYWNNSSSRIVFDNAHFNTAWLGRENAMYKSTDGASSFALNYTFSNNTDDRVLWIEQCYSNSDCMYTHFVTGNQSHIYRTVNSGDSWQEIDVPSTLREMVFTVSDTNPDELWVAYYYGVNGQKIFHTTDAGANWTNITTSTLNGEEIWAIAHQYGTDGGVYVAVKNGAVYYRNNQMEDWQLYASGLPASTEPLRIVPFYKGEKIRLATWNLGVWEAPFFEPSEVIADFASERGTFQCPGESMHFVNHSVVPDGSTFLWTFPGATPATSTQENPTVVYDQEGFYDVTLQVTFGGNTYTKTRSNYVGTLTATTEPVYEDFETGAFDTNWSMHHSTNGTGTWQVSEDASGFGVGSYAMKFDNWYFDAEGNRDEVWLPTWSVGNLQNAAIYFDVAYSRYNATWSDTLAVLVSLDCGGTWQEVFVKGGTELSTAPDQSGSPFIPLNIQWRMEEIVLADFFPVGSVDQVIVAFQNRGYYGQWLYIDHVNLIEAMSVEEPNEHTVTISAYPNPAHDLIHLELLEVNEATSLEVFDLLGKKIWSTKLNAGQRQIRTIDVSDWALGTYVARVVGSSNQNVVKFEVR